MKSKLKHLFIALCFTPMLAVSNTPKTFTPPTEKEIILMEYFSDIVFIYDESKDPYLVKSAISDLNKDEKLYLYNRLIKEVKMSTHHKNIFRLFIKELKG